ncbi:MAG: TIGR02253 family HAD-type hydrolase [Candidatus Micrarchaeota archaeon]|nr:TIGR02253 family HAD-type hydrolase [Candidatus Micrarchaeota archaeon]
MPIKDIFFDIDDTLFPSSEFAELARRNAVRAMIEMGLGETQEKLHSMLIKIIAKKGSNYHNHFNDLCAALKLKKSSRYVAAAIAAYHNTKTSILPYPEIPRMLLKLKEDGYGIYVATNGDAIKQWDKLIRLGIEHYFEDVFVSEEMGEEKSPSFFRKVLKQIKAKPEECIMIGDREASDIVPAKRVGIITIRVRRGKHAKGKSTALFDVNNLEKLPLIIKKIK